MSQYSHAIYEDGDRKILVSGGSNVNIYTCGFQSEDIDSTAQLYTSQVFLGHILPNSYGETSISGATLTNSDERDGRYGNAGISENVFKDIQYSSLYTNFNINNPFFDNVQVDPSLNINAIFGLAPRASHKLESINDTQYQDFLFTILSEFSEKYTKLLVLNEWGYGTDVLQFTVKDRPIIFNTISKTITWNNTDAIINLGFNYEHPVYGSGIANITSGSLYRDEYIKTEYQQTDLSNITWNIGSNHQLTHNVVNVANDSLYFKSIQLDTPTISYNNSTKVLSWNAIEHVSTYIVYRNGTAVSYTNATTYNVTNPGVYTVRCADNPTLYIDKQEGYYYPNSIGLYHADIYASGYYQSDMSNSITVNKLSTPNISIVKNMNTNGGVESISISWPSVQNAVQYKIKDVYTSTQHVQSTSYNISTNPVYLLDDSLETGNHKIYIKAMAFTTDSNLDSDYTADNNDLIFDITQLDDLLVYWLSSGTGKLADQSTITYMIDPDSDIDYTVVNVTTGTNTYTYTKKYSANNAVRIGNIIPTPITTNTYTVTVKSKSYDSFYLRENTSNSLTYNTIKIGKATNIAYDTDTLTLTWTAPANANYYRIYELVQGEGNLLAISNTNSYTFTSQFSSDLHTLYIESYKVTMESEMDVSVYTNPRYLWSDQSDYYYLGTINAPTNVTRSGNVVSWDAVSSAEFYEVYDGNNLLANTNNTYLTLSLGTGSHEIKIKAVRYIGSTAYKSGFSSAVSFTITQLSAPVISFQGNTRNIIWSTVSHVYYYDVYVDNVLTDTIEYDEGQPYNPAPNPELYELGNHSVKFIARATDSFLYPASNFSNSLTFSILKLDAPTIEYNTVIPGKITSSLVEHAWTYILYKNDAATSVAHPEVGETYVDFDDYTPPTSGSDSLYAIVSANQTTDANPYYRNSDISNMLLMGTLATPVISINDNRITWNTIPNALSYNIYNGEELLINITDNEYTLTATDNANFAIRVKAIGNGSTLLDSGYSNTITYYISRLNTPNITYDNGVLTWLAIENADYYEVYLNNVINRIVYTTSFEPTLYAGYNKLYVIAKSNQYRYLDSYKSNEIIESKLPTNETFIKVYDKNVKDYVIYPLIYPLSFNETIDETMDNMKCITATTQVKDPFEAYTNVSVYIYSGGNPIDGFPKHMVISEDNVEEVQLGADCRYKHNLTLIERTKLLETEFVNDMSITQTVEYVMYDNLPDNEKNKVDPIFGGNTVLTDRDGNILLEEWEQSLPNALGIDEFWEWAVFIAAFVAAFGLSMAIPATGEVIPNSGLSLATYLFHTKIKHRTNLQGLNGTEMGSLNKAYNKNDTNNNKILLPTNNSTYYNIQTTSTSEYLNDTWWGHVIRFVNTGVIGSVIDQFLVKRLVNDTTNFNSLNDRGVKLHKRFYYRPHSDNYEKSSQYPETFIGSTRDNSQVYWDIGNIPNGFYDIILVIDGTDTDNLYDMPINIQSDAYRGYEGTLDEINFMLNPGYNPDDYRDTVIPDAAFREYRAIWSNIEINSRTIVDEEETKGFTVTQGIEKALNELKPLTYKSGKLDTRKYELDNSIKQITDKISCPELTFTGTKSLYEVLQTFGRLFYGVPRLGLKGESNPSNIITFDIMDSKLIQENEQFVDSNNKEDITSTIENHTTGYISNLKNVVTNNTWSVFPAGDIWTTPRTSSNDSIEVTLSNMSVVLDKPIYKLVDIYIKNFDKQDPDRTLSLKKFCYEKTLFNSLNNNNAGKGMAIYYTQGYNTIDGLGQIPEANEFYSTIGFSEDKYVIENILMTAYGYLTGTLNPANQFQYKVVYIPLNDNIVYTEQANIAGLGVPTYKVFNQDDNMINDYNFGNSVQTQIERLGNNAILKNYRLFLNNNDTDNAYSKAPYIGQIKVYDGYKYYADNITSAYYNNRIDVSVNFSKNFNKINERIGVNSLYRLYEIYNNHNIDRNINMNNYCYISTDNYVEDASKYTSLTNTNYNLVANIKNSFNNGSNYSEPVDKPSVFYVRPLKEDSTRLTYTDYFGTNTNVPCSVIPASCNTFKNSIAFNGEFYDNYAAGTNAVVEYKSALTPASSPGKFNVKDVRYCDDKGNTPLLGITLCNPTISQLELTEDEFNEYYNDNLYPIPALGSRSFKNKYERVYPMARYHDTPKNTFTNAIMSEKYLVEKDNREKLCLNWQLFFQTYDKDIFIHKGIVYRLYKNSNVLDSDDLLQSPQYVFYKGDLNKVDRMTSQPIQVAGTPTFTNSTNKITIGSVTVTADDNYDGIALMWRDGTLIYTINDNIVKNTSVVIPNIYLNFFDTKIDYRVQ